jgi:hypothetical protein
LTNGTAVHRYGGASPGRTARPYRKKGSRRACWNVTELAVRRSQEVGETRMPSPPVNPKMANEALALLWQI